MGTFHVDSFDATHLRALSVAATDDVVYIVAAHHDSLVVHRFDGTWTTTPLGTEGCLDAAIAIAGDAVHVVAVVGCAVWNLEAQPVDTTHLRHYVLRKGTWSGTPIAGQTWGRKTRPFALAAGGGRLALLLGGPEGTLLDFDKKWTTRASWPTQHEHTPPGIAIGPDGTVYVATPHDQHLEVREIGAKAGKPETIGERYMTRHVSLAVAPDGTVALGAMGGTSSNDRACIFTRTKGKWSAAAMPDKKGNNGFDLRLAYDASGTLHAAWRTEKSRASGGARTVAAAPLRYTCAPAWKMVDVMDSGAPAGCAVAPDGRVWIASGTYPRGGLKVANNRAATKPAAEQAAAPLGTPWMQLLAKVEKIIETSKRVRLHSPDGKKFFEATVSGTTVIERTGKLSEAGTETRKDFPKEKAAAKRAWSRAVDYLDKEWTIVE